MGVEDGNWLSAYHGPHQLAGASCSFDYFEMAPEKQGKRSQTIYSLDGFVCVFSDPLQRSHVFKSDDANLEAGERVYTCSVIDTRVFIC